MEPQVETEDMIILEKPERNLTKFNSTWELAGRGVVG